MDAHTMLILNSIGSFDPEKIREVVIITWTKIAPTGVSSLPGGDHPSRHKQMELVVTSRKRSPVPTLAIIEDEIPSGTGIVDLDAREFGLLFKQGGWRLGLLVARCVYLQDHGGSHSEVESDTLNAKSQCDFAAKVTVQEFAAKSGISETSVKTYYHAWQHAAEDGRVTTADVLVPGQEDIDGLGQFEEYDEELRADWPKYMRKAREPKKPVAERKTRERKPKPQPTEDQLVELDDVILCGALGDLLERARVLVADVQNVGVCATEHDFELLDLIAEQGEDLTKTAQTLKSTKQLENEED